MKTTGLEPSPQRRKGLTWKEFLKTHWQVLAATDFFTVELWTPSGLIRYHVLFVIRLATREVQLAGNPMPPGCCKWRVLDGSLDRLPTFHSLFDP